jgi:membrane protein
MGWLVNVLAIAFGLAANTLLFLVMFRLLAKPDLPWRAVLSGALLGAILFEILKQVSRLLISTTQGQPAFQVFGIALILVVWINYASRVFMYAASWAWSAPTARARRVAEPADPVQGPPLPSLDDLPTDEDTASRKGAFVAGAAAGAAAAAAVIKSRSSDD